MWVAGEEMDASVLIEVSELPRWMLAEGHEDLQPLRTRVYLNEKRQCHDMVLKRNDGGHL